MPEATATTLPTPEGEGSDSQPRNGGIDVAQLAEKVYRLMLAETRLALAFSRPPAARARGGGGRYVRYE